jgi:putative component of membrane protein insertase Oxa1/YidC/SpoIIIJ protein YidD
MGIFPFKEKSPWYKRKSNPRRHHQQSETLNTRLRGCPCGMDVYLNLFLISTPLGGAWSDSRHRPLCRQRKRLRGYALHSQSVNLEYTRRHVPLSAIECDSCVFIPQPSSYADRSYTDHAIPVVRWGSILRIHRMGQRHLGRNPRYPKPKQQHSLMATLHTQTCNTI